MRTTAKVDYAVRAALVLAAGQDAHGTEEVPLKAADVAAQQTIPPKFLESILADLKRAEIVSSRRGSDGGYWLARPATEITVADIIRAVEGPLADVRGIRPEALEYDGLESLQRMWVAVRANLRAVLEKVTLADLAAGQLPKTVEALVTGDDAWSAH